MAWRTAHLLLTVSRVPWKQMSNQTHPCQDKRWMGTFPYPKGWEWLLSLGGKQEYKLFQSWAFGPLHRRVSTVGSVSDFSMSSDGPSRTFFLCLQKDGHLTHFCSFSPETQTSPRMCSFCPISLKQTWLTVSPEPAWDFLHCLPLALQEKAVCTSVLDSLSLRGHL